MLRFARGSTAWLMAPLALVLGLAFLASQPGLRWVAWLALVPGAVFVFFMAFFRDPDRMVADGIASPADGRVVFIDEVDDALLGHVERFSIFMHPKDVHVNRFPFDSEVVSVTHIPGKHIPAWDKDSDRNERVETVLRMADGAQVKVIQIAGALARRIVPYHEAGMRAAKGQRMGLIRLGSRCDLLVPPGRAKWTAVPGQQVYAGATSLGSWASDGDAPSAHAGGAGPGPALPAPTRGPGPMAGRPAAEALPRADAAKAPLPSSGQGAAGPRPKAEARR